MQYAFNVFISNLDKIVNDEHDQGEIIVQRAEPLLKRLTTDMSWLSPQFREPKTNGSVQYLLYRSPRLKYTVTSAVFWPNYTTKIHDHGTWGLICVWRGEEREERFRRTDDGTRANRAMLSLRQTVVNAEGSVSQLVPPERDIHRIQTTSTIPSCSIHVYGADLSGKPRHEYDLDAGEIREFQLRFVEAVDINKNEKESEVCR